ncbi:AraC family ligand binding domain-containing protein [Peribacillus sp. NPDC096379]|uniref:AraC family ligand binding domain-containing protein n=1 Tax=Peribacillus sp. NPDC096379 TaxID=3364393 RepID=UPI0037F82FD2
MVLNRIDKWLKDLTPKEKRNKETSQLSDYYTHLETKNIDGKEVYIFDSLIPENQEFHISRHNRFAIVPAHIHTFIEINYVYSGQCKQVIDGKEVTLSRGQICLVDTDVPHSILETTEDDIIINILIRKEYFIKTLSNK